MELFWLSDRQWGRIEPLLPKVHTGPVRVDEPTGHQRHPFRPARRLPLAGAAGRLRATHDGLQSLQMAFFASAIVKAAVDGRLPHGVSLSSLSEPPLLWEGPAASRKLIVWCGQRSAYPSDPPGGATFRTTQIAQANRGFESPSLQKESWSLPRKRASRECKPNTGVSFAT
jgi:hypothetical protein